MNGQPTPACPDLQQMVGGLEIQFPADPIQLVDLGLLQGVGLGFGRDGVGTFKVPDRLVIGSIGPTGEILMPVGSLDPAAAEAAFRAQAEALAEGGVDILWIETMSSAEELQAAVQAASGLGLPVCATMSFDTNGRTMMGLTPDAALSLAHRFVPPLAGFGANCGIGPAQLLATLLGFSRFERQGEVIIAKGNCGIPEYRDGAIHYTGTPDIMADYALLARDAGARIIGGCCGTQGQHIAAMRRALDTTEPEGVPDVARIEALLGPVTAADTKPVESPRGERRRGRSRSPA